MARSRGKSGGEEEFDQAEDAVQEVENEEQQKNGGVRMLNLVRGYVLLFVGVGLIVWSFVGAGSVQPGALTLGGALIGFNPLFRATVGSGGHGH